MVADQDYTHPLIIDIRDTVRATSPSQGGWRPPYRLAPDQDAVRMDVEAIEQIHGMGARETDWAKVRAMPPLCWWRMVRRAHGLSEVELAREMGVPYGVVYQWESRWPTGRVTRLRFERAYAWFRDAGELQVVDGYRLRWYLGDVASCQVPDTDTGMDIGTGSEHDERLAQ